MLTKKENASIFMHLAPSEKEAFRDSARLAGMTLSAWIRDRLRKESRRELQEAGAVVPFLRSEAG